MKKLLIIALLFWGCDYAPTEHTHTETLQHGCLDSLAMNYDSTVVIDNNSCEFKQGCLDSLALNYDSTAVLNNNSCEYEVVPETCMAEIIGCDESEDFSHQFWWGSSNNTSTIECHITIINTGQDTLSSVTSNINLKNYNDAGLLNIENYTSQGNDGFGNAFMVLNDTLNANINFEIDTKFTRCIDGSDSDWCEREFDDLVEFTISHIVICY